ncbi:hypothetical protein CFE70_010482 [Pyrenophora teres f. teres 0-1]
MASSLRPGLFSQVCAKPQTSQRMLSTSTTSTINRPLAQQVRPAFQRSVIQQSTRIAAFHATQRNSILPPLPRRLSVPQMTPRPYPTQTTPTEVTTGASRDSLRIVSAGLIPLTVAPFAAGSLNPVTDSILSCIVDYFPKKRVPKTRAAAMWALRAGTVVLGLALYSFETNDVGITEAVARLWHA